MKRISQRTAFATLVLVIAIAGAAVAAGTITGRDIKDGSLTGRDVKDHSLTRKDFRGSVRGPSGPPGPAGTAGPQGPAGPSALSGITPVAGSLTVAPGTVNGGTVPCPAGQKVVSGGFGYGGDDTEVFVSAANTDRTGWTVALDNVDGTTPAELDGFAYCAGAGQAVAARAPNGRMQPPTGRLARLIAARNR
jgi:hypothetical protein